MQLVVANSLLLLLFFVLSMRCVAFGRSSLRTLHLVTTYGGEIFGTTSSSSFLNQYCRKESLRVSRRVFNSSSTSNSSNGVKSKMAAFEPSTNTHIVDNLKLVQSKVEQAGVAAERDPSKLKLCAVGKTKPAGDIQLLYDVGHRLFGENYAQELIEKSAILPPDIQWHFIGSLQSNKVKPLLRDVPNLECIQTVSSEKLATKLSNAVSELNRACLDVYVQIDTSGEDTKSGILPEEATGLVTHIVANCPNISIRGLMTIGAPGDLSCFDKLVEVREEVARFLRVDSASLELSMGMSGDFEEAIAKGATVIRCGSNIFGVRDYSNKSK